MQRFGAIVVLYNKYYEDSITLQSFTSLPFTLLIIDNSDQAQYYKHNQELANNPDVYYHPFTKNVGLSKAYNFGVNFFKDKCEYLCLFDDDTYIGANYLTLLNNFDFKPKVIYTPLIYLNDTLVNPTYHNNNVIVEYIKAKNYRSIETIKPLITTDHVYAINSGLIIPMEFYNHFTYDEHIFLDCIDYDFCNQVYKQGYYIDIFPVKIKQNYNTLSIKDQSYEANLKRLTIRFKDLAYVAPYNYYVIKAVVLYSYYKATNDKRYLQLIFKKIK